VEAIDTLIGDITPPESLMKTQTDRKIAEEQRKTYETQQAAETQRQQLVRQTSLADIQNDVVKAEQGVSIAQLHAASTVKQAEGEAAAISLRAAGEAEGTRIMGEAKAAAYRSGVEALGPESYAMIQLIQIIAEKNLRIVPDVLVSGSQGSAGLLDSLLATLTHQRVTR
jgi:uncharacterized membrane protein YqiK